MISIGLSIAKFAETGTMGGSLLGDTTIGATVSATMIWRRFKAVGEVIVFEIQDTIKPSPTEANTMKTASITGIVSATILCACFGYAAFGGLAPQNILNGFSSYKANWLVNLAHAALFIDLIASYQAYCQPFLVSIEKLVTERFPDAIFITKEIKVRIPGFRPYKLNLFPLVWRTISIIISIIISKFIPDSSEAVGLV
ncbi:Amino acid permease [Melia azedarach]|uniref:Amino acid permease n=1 Tax=Melia azedarach TaxID=155640 RepID=A0ACC1WNX4_MELAZ|nr:Amino acid permease [Melia azedarach]